MKFTLLLTLAVIVLMGCQTETVIEQAQSKTGAANSEAERDNAMEESMVHIGCQEGEIEKDGSCVPAEDNNAKLFGQDLDRYVDTEEVDDGALGFLAKPKEPGDYPGVVMIHEWWGLNDNIKEMAKLLAKEGYVVFAVDLYDGEVAADSTKARELSGSVRSNPDKAIADMKNAVNYLKDEQAVSKLASLGWCFGGQQSLQLSLYEDLDATVIYYGQLVDDKDQLRSIDSPVLGIFGSEDTSIPVSSVRSFETSLDDLGIDNEIHVYDGVGHAFANPSGSNYAPDETIDAWMKTVAFLDESLKTTVMGDTEVKAAVSETKTFILTGENFKFLMDGGESPELKVKVGDRVRIDFVSTSGFHDWVVDEFDAATERVRDGGSTSVEFIADKTGTFEYYCSVGSHRGQGMRGNLIVEPETKVFELAGENFKFTMDGEDAPEIRVKKGDKVRIELVSTSGFHDWVVDEFDVATERVRDGESTFVEFIADETGTFEYYCSVGSHRQLGMRGNLIVE